MFERIRYNGTEVEVSPCGIVKWNGKIRQEHYNRDGYSVVSIKTQDGWRSVRVARLVALAFIPNPLNLSEVNHKDYNRKNSYVDNLEWISHKDNVIYSNCNRPNYKGSSNPNYGNRVLSQRYAQNKKLAKEKQSRAGLKNGMCKPIELYCDGEFVKRFEWIQECAEYLIKEYNLRASLTSVRDAINKSHKNNRAYLKRFTFIK